MRRSASSSPRFIAAFDDISTTEKRQAATPAKRQAELKSMQDRLLNAFLATSIDQATFDAKSAELRDEIARVRESEAALAKLDPRCADSAPAIFDRNQNAAQTRRGSNNAVRREILDAICLNRAVSDVTLVTVKRKPFDVLAEGLSLKKSRGDCRFTLLHENEGLELALSLFPQTIEFVGDAVLQHVEPGLYSKKRRGPKTG